jgi:uncharacterized membrane protein YhaH (DUF805 family)
MDWYVQAIRKYAVFTGRSRRKEYWSFVFISWGVPFALATILAIAVPSILTFGADENVAVLFYYIVGIIYLSYFFHFIPSISVLVRRLHDIGRSGAWVFLSLIPFFGGLVLLFFTLSDSQPGSNAYGPNPKLG